MKINKEWEGETDLSSLISCQTTIEYTPSPTRESYKYSINSQWYNLKYDNTLIYTDAKTRPMWILLNNHSTVDEFSNKNML